MKPLHDQSQAGLDPATTRGRGALRVVRLQPTPSYERATLEALADRARERVQHEWQEAGLAEMYGELAPFVHEPPPSLDELASRLGLDVEQTKLEVHRIRVDWLELLCEEAELLLDGATPRSPQHEQADPVEQKSDADSPAAPDDAYQLVELLGSGLHGLVYRARHCRSNAVVALKVFDGKDRDVERFHSEFELAAQLRHPNIVRVRDRGEIGGRPCFSMDLVHGGTLADEAWLQRFREPGSAVALVVKVARAVQFAHEHGILHRDLKPSNILIDEHGEPHLSDFSLGRKLGEERSHSGAIAGTFAFMAPEQAGARDEPISTATDVYGLGAVLYKLLTGEPPNPELLFSALRRFERAEPPRRLTPQANPNVRPGISADLEAVCLKALEPVPTKRYQTAAAFADDLERALEGRPTLARPLGPWGRVTRWARRHPVLSSVIAIGAIALLIVNGAMLLVLRSQHRELLQATLKENATLATLQAQHVASVFEDYAQRVTHLASDPLVRTIAQGPTRRHAMPELQPLAEGFDSLLILDRDAHVRARWPYQQARDGYYDRSFAFRDYLQGARQLPRDSDSTSRQSAFVSRVFRSQADDRNLKFALSSVIYGDRNQVVGFAVVTKSAASTLENVSLELYGGQVTALLAPRDRESASQLLPSGYTVLLHEDVDKRAEYTVPPRFAERARSHFGGSAAPGEQFEHAAAAPLEVDDYTDPVPGYGGRWVAGFSAVARTGYVVGVGTPYRGISPLLWRIFVGINVAFALGTLVVMIVLRRRRGRQPGP
jgi:serine/threonine-protein kinase